MLNLKTIESANILNLSAAEAAALKGSNELLLNLKEY
jgi:hypothetical protein